MQTLSIVGLAALLLAGCRGPEFDSRPGVQSQGPHEYMFVKSSGKKAGFSALELEQLARLYAAERKLQFQFENTEKVIWIRTDGSPIIADVYFMAGLGKSSLHIEIDRDGKVKRHEILTEVCGTK